MKYFTLDEMSNYLWGRLCTLTITGLSIIALMFVSTQYVMNMQSALIILFVVCPLIIYSIILSVWTIHRAAKQPELFQIIPDNSTPEAFHESMKKVCNTFLLLTVFGFTGYYFNQIAFLIVLGIGVFMSAIIDSWVTREEKKFNKEIADDRA